MINHSISNLPHRQKYLRNVLDAVESVLNNPAERVNYGLPLIWCLERRKNILKELLDNQLKAFDRS
jgi:hypothetical protein